MASVPPPIKLDTLQAGRGIAALLVVIFHLNESILAKEKYLGHELLRIFRGGSSGVEFFFVLSGFLMMWLYHKRLGDTQFVRTFLSRRFARIYPIYWLILTAVVPVYFIIPSFGEGYETNLVDIVASYTLFPIENHPILGVAWTLRHEVFFYLMFAALIAFPRYMKWGFLVWGLVSFAANFLDADPFIISRWNVIFLIGVLAALYCRGNVAYPRLWAIAGVVGFAAGIYMRGYELASGEVTTIVFGLASAAILIGFVSLEHKGHVEVSPWLVKLGDTSYSLYLVHFPVLSLLAKVFFSLEFASAVPDVLVAVIFVLAAVVAGAMTHYLVERRLVVRDRSRPPKTSEAGAPDVVQS
ncbi:acyltransferase family protein [Novosphingobium mangrovi (ex Hu et al. 2023)]|uniref:Acyltransferase n=1 Tax=Novosphingobium mangrovi (ex Hu et al. 2023) TaxID=2930094 RepID=A0ABT0ACA7_9SPHN|nr:acyltransferase [Novosphingobium mangrovi (ex Hu et al. 2023)]MCJ1960827.1 acyltransferase [Novosphingobium mangrovi (ex Hu et al. 2023)]